MTAKILVMGYSLIIALGIFLIIKNTNEFNQEIKVINAISDYLHHKNKHGFLDTKEIYDMFSSMGYYKNPIYRVFDWGCENIVPQEVYDKIKPYL